MRGLIAYLPVRSGSSQMPRCPGQADGRFDDRDLALLHDQHRHGLDAHEVRVQRI
jgi:hypothetical protein